MIKRTLFFANPAYLHTKNEQLIVQFPERKEKKEISIAIEDLGYIVLEHPQITITNRLVMKLVQNKTAIITCDQQHLPCAFLQPLVGHSEQSERIRFQLNASLPLKKNLWQQTIQSKIQNQASHLLLRNKNALKLKRWASQVTTGDHDHHEAIAAAYYFQHLFDIPGFSRNQKGTSPNHLLNYGYAILRAVTARALISSGMLPSVGIFHQNKYNAFCLADDIMEPYRPFVDTLVFDITQNFTDYEVLSKELKSILLKIPTIDVSIDGKQSPLMVAMSRTTHSLSECFRGTSRKILYPEYGK